MPLPAKIDLPVCHLARCNSHSRHENHANSAIRLPASRFCSSERVGEAKNDLPVRHGQTPDPLQQFALCGRRRTCRTGPDSFAGFSCQIRDRYAQHPSNCWQKARSLNLSLQYNCDRLRRATDPPRQLGLADIQSFHQRRNAGRKRVLRQWSTGSQPTSRTAIPETDAQPPGQMGARPLFREPADKCQRYRHLPHAVLGRTSWRSLIILATKPRLLMAECGSIKHTYCAYCETRSGPVFC